MDYGLRDFDFVSLLSDNAQQKIKSEKIELIQFNYQQERMKIKTINRLNVLKERLQKNISSDILYKKFQIKSLYEFKMLNDYVKTLTEKYELYWYNDTNGQITKKLTSISGLVYEIPRYYGIWPELGSYYRLNYPEFKKIEIPAMYCKLRIKK